MCRVCFWIMVIVQLLVSQSLAGQDGTERHDGNILEEDVVCSELAEKLVRVRAQSLQEMEGRLFECVNDSIYLSSDSGVHTVSLKDIRGLWVRSSQATKVAITSGIMSGGLCAAFFVGISGILGEGSAAKYGIFGATVGFIPGALIGSVIGSKSHKWNLWYEYEGEESSRRDHHELEFYASQRLDYEARSKLKAFIPSSMTNKRNLNDTQISILCFPYFIKQDKSIGLALNIQF